MASPRFLSHAYTPVVLWIFPELSLFHPFAQDFPSAWSVLRLFPLPFPCPFSKYLLPPCHLFPSMPASTGFSDSLPPLGSLPPWNPQGTAYSSLLTLTSSSSLPPAQVWVSLWNHSASPLPPAQEWDRQTYSDSSKRRHSSLDTIDSQYIILKEACTRSYVIVKC